jgi:hypothetical protein
MLTLSMMLVALRLIVSILVRHAFIRDSALLFSSQICPCSKPSSVGCQYCRLCAHFLELQSETDRVTNFMKTYLGHISFYIIDCLIYGNLCRVDAPLKLLQPLDTPENPAERISYVGGYLGARFSKFRRRNPSVQYFTLL